MSSIDVDREARQMAAIYGLCFLAIMGSILGWAWYSAGVQARVYQRQGIQISQWECFVGAQPPDRIMHEEQK